MFSIFLWITTILASGSSFKKSSYKCAFKLLTCTYTLCQDILDSHFENIPHYKSPKEICFLSWWGFFFEWKMMSMKISFYETFSFRRFSLRRNMLYKYLGTDYDRFVTDWPHIYIYIGSISLIDGEVIIYRPDNEVLRDNDKENISYDWRSTSISIMIRLCLS